MAQVALDADHIHFISSRVHGGVLAVMTAKAPRKGIVSRVIGIDAPVQLDIRKMQFGVNEKGYYGKYGGAYIPEMLYPNVEELRENYLKIIESPEFQDEFRYLLKNYVGRPTPLYLAE